MLPLLAACSPAPDPVDVEVCEGSETVELERVPTWSDDVAPIVARECAGCHVEKGIGPFPLRSYEDAWRVAPLMAAAVLAREMPPFPPRDCEPCNTYRDARWLSAEEIATIVAWADADAPAGDEDAPFPPVPAGRTLDPASTIVLQSQDAYTPDEDVEDDYRCFASDPGLATDRYVTGFDVVPGDAREVHHVLVFVVPDDATEASVAALEADDADPGYTCFGGPGFDGTLIAGWAPGGGATLFPEDTGLLVPAGRSIVVQVHYNAANGRYPDRTAVHLSFADTVGRPAQLLPISASDELYLPPGEPVVEVTHAESFAVAASTVWGAAGHMHTRGLSIAMTAEEACLFDVPDWDFHWQGLYFYEQPLTSSGGGDVTLTCRFDTSEDTEEVTWGESTSDEMCLGYLFVTIP